jgi:RNA polymerase sigma factor for flagellar operon FliA
MQAPETEPGEPSLDPARGGLGAEELGLWIRWREQRDESARAALLQLHLHYAKTVAAVLYAQRAHNDIEFDDYLQLARVGMLESFDRYDPTFGAQFRTFAARRMRGAVLDGLARLSERYQQVAFRRRVLAERTASMVEAQPEAEPSKDSRSGESMPELFQRLAEVGVGLALGFLLENTGMFDPGEAATVPVDSLYRAVELRDTRRHLHTLVKLLPAREREVITLHYLHGHAFEDVARQLKLTKGRISQLHKKALGTLRILLADRESCDRSG